MQGLAQKRQAAAVHIRVYDDAAKPSNAEGVPVVKPSSAALQQSKKDAQQEYMLHLLQQRAEVPFQHAGLPAVASISAVYGLTGQRGDQVRRQLAVVLCPADGMHNLRACLSSSAAADMPSVDHGLTHAVAAACMQYEHAIHVTWHTHQ